MVLSNELKKILEMCKVSYDVATIDEFEKQSKAFMDSYPARNTEQDVEDYLEGYRGDFTEFVDDFLSVNFNIKDVVTHDSIIEYMLDSLPEKE